METASKRFASWETGNKKQKNAFNCHGNRGMQMIIWRGGQREHWPTPPLPVSFGDSFTKKRAKKNKQHKQQRRTVTKNRANHTSQITSCMCGLSSAWNMELSSLLDNNSSLSVSAWLNRLYACSSVATVDREGRQRK